MILEKDLNYKSSRLSYRHLTQSDATMNTHPGLMTKMLKVYS